MLDVLVQHIVDAATSELRRVPQPQQVANLQERHIQSPAIQDELQALALDTGVEPVIAIATRRLGQQRLSLVIADGLHGHIEQTGEIADAVGLWHGFLQVA